jgi:hypothetical protein
LGQNIKTLPRKGIEVFYVITGDRQALGGRNDGGDLFLSPTGGAQRRFGDENFIVTKAVARYSRDIS